MASLEPRTVCARSCWCYGADGQCVHRCGSAVLGARPVRRGEDAAPTGLACLCSVGGCWPVRSVRTLRAHTLRGHPTGADG